jgi:hypothetical protein
MVSATDALREALAKSRTLASTLLSYVHLFTVQAGQTALANVRGKIEQRLARWLLMALDRLGGSDLLLTHEFLSIMLGVRRAGVTQAINALEARGLISSARGQITVHDREGLEDAAGASTEWLKLSQHAYSTFERRTRCKPGINRRPAATARPSLGSTPARSAASLTMKLTALRQPSFGPLDGSESRRRRPIAPAGIGGVAAACRSRARCHVWAPADPDLLIAREHEIVHPN